MRRHEAVVHDGTPETVEEDLAVMPRRVRLSLMRQLAEGERIVIRTRQHWGVLGRHTLWPIGTAAIWLFLVLDVKAAPPLIDVVTWVFLAGLVRLAWADLEHRYSWVIVTNKRILKHEGLITRKMPMMRLTKVTDMTYHRSALGEVLGYGTIIIESAGQQQAIRDLTFVPEPDDISAALNSEIFGERPRTKKDTTRRSWPRITPTRRRRGDDGDDPGPGGAGPGNGPGPGDGPPRGRGPGPRDNAPTGTGGGVDVSPAGHPPRPRLRERTQPETWYRSSNLGRPRRVGDTGEIPVVHAGAPGRVRWQQGGEAERWLAERRAEERRRADAVEPDPDPFARWGYTARHGHEEGETPAAPAFGADDGQDPNAAREIPLYPPRDWT